VTLWLITPVWFAYIRLNIENKTFAQQTVQRRNKLSNVASVGRGMSVEYSQVRSHTSDTNTHTHTPTERETQISLTGYFWNSPSPCLTPLAPTKNRRAGETTCNSPRPKDDQGRAVVYPVLGQWRQHGCLEDGVCFNSALKWEKMGSLWRMPDLPPDHRTHRLISTS